MIPTLAFFLTGPATAAGKTYVTRALAASLRRRTRAVLALKPIETGAAPEPRDALALGRACGHPELASAAGLYRAALPLSPYAVTLETGQPAPDLAALCARIAALAAGADVLLVEGAGGLLAPLDATRSIADLARALGLPLVLVARDALGVLSSVSSCVESAHARGLRVAAVVLARHERGELDPSVRTNRRILAEQLACPVVAFPCCADDDHALADAAEACGLLAALGLDAVPPD